MKKISLYDIEDIKIGHSENYEGGTGCSVILCKEGASAGVDVRGGAPGTRETDLLNPMEMVEKVHGVVLSGGSAFGLDASSGVMKYLEERNIGFDVGVTKVPIVCQAVLFDLATGDSRVRPDSSMGYEACNDSEKAFEDKNGNYGAGTGASIGKILGPKYSMKGGLGSYALQIGELKIGALVAVNCLGDVVSSTTGEIIAGALKEDMNTFLNTEEYMISHYENMNNVFKGNTTIGAIITNAKISKSQANKIASMAHNGYARAIRPAHTMFDGDTIFTMGTNKVQADINVLGMLSARVMEQAITNAITNAKGSYGLKAFKDLNN